MRKALTVLALAAACGLATSTAAQAKDLTGWFVNAGVGTAHYHATDNNVDLGSNSHTSGMINFGWRSRFIGVEAGYTNLGSVSGSDGIGDSYDLRGDGWTLGFNGHFNPTKMWYISARTGLFLWKIHGTATLNDGMGGIKHYADSEQSGDWYAGVGTGVDFNRHLSLGVHFNYYKIKKSGFDVGTRIFTVNFEYRF